MNRPNTIVRLIGDGMELIQRHAGCLRSLGRADLTGSLTALAVLMTGLVLTPVGSAADSTVPGTFATIQAAIDDPGTVNGDTITVTSQTISEMVVINKEVTIDGTDESTTIITLTVPNSHQAFQVIADNVTIKNLTIQSATHGIYIYNPGAPNDPTPGAPVGTITGTTIEDVTVTGGSASGIEFHNDTAITTTAITRCTLDDNLNGIRMASDALVNGVTITDTKIRDTLNINNNGIVQLNNGGPGLGLGHVINMTITGTAPGNSVISGYEDGSGVFAERIANSTIKNTTFTGNLVGVQILSQTDSSDPVAQANAITIQDNTFNDHLLETILIGIFDEDLGASGITILGNTINQDTSALVEDVSLIEVTLGSGWDHGPVSITNNTLNGSGAAGGTNVDGVCLLGDIHAATLTGNTVNYSAVTGAGGLTGVILVTNDDDNVLSGSGDNIMTSDANITIQQSDFDGLDYAVRVLNLVGGASTDDLPAGANLDIWYNSFETPAVFGIDAGAGSPTIDASGNWWGSTVEATVAVLVGDNTIIDFTPYLGNDTDSDTDPSNGFQSAKDDLWVVSPEIFSPAPTVITNPNAGQQIGNGRIQEAIDRSGTAALFTILAAALDAGDLDDTTGLDAGLVTAGLQADFTTGGFPLTSPDAHVVTAGSEWRITDDDDVYTATLNAGDLDITRSRITLNSGFYDEQDIQINKPVAILGQGSGTTATDSIIDGTPVARAQTTVLHIDNDDVTLKDFRVRNSASHGLLIDKFMQGPGADDIDSTIIDNIFSVDNALSGLEIHNESDVTNLIVVNSWFSGNLNGIRFASDASANGVIVTNSTFTGNDSYGIFQINSSAQAPTLKEGYITNVTILNNNFLNSEGGIYAERINDALIDSNIFTENFIGIQFIIQDDDSPNPAQQAADIVIQNNTFDNLDTDNAGTTLVDEDVKNAESILIALFDEALLDNDATNGGLYIWSNTFNQDVGSLAEEVSLIDLTFDDDDTTYTHANVIMDNNNFNFSGTYSSDQDDPQAADAICLAGGLTDVDITSNTFEGADVGKAAVFFATNTDDSNAGGADIVIPAGTDVYATQNIVRDFAEVARLKNLETGTLGGLTTGARVNFYNNSFTSSVIGISTGFAGDGEKVQASFNYWGSTDEDNIFTAMLGTKDEFGVIDTNANVDFSPFLAAGAAAMDVVPFNAAESFPYLFVTGLGQQCDCATIVAPDPFDAMDDGDVLKCIIQEAADAVDMTGTVEILRLVRTELTGDVVAQFVRDDDELNLLLTTLDALDATDISAPINIVANLFRTTFSDVVIDPIVGGWADLFTIRGLPSVTQLIGGTQLRGTVGPALTVTTKARFEEFDRIFTSSANSNTVEIGANGDVVFRNATIDESATNTTETAAIAVTACDAELDLGTTAEDGGNTFVISSGGTVDLLSPSTTDFFVRLDRTTGAACAPVGSDVSALGNTWVLRNTTTNTDTTLDISSLTDDSNYIIAQQNYDLADATDKALGLIYWQVDGAKIKIYINGDNSFSGLLDAIESVAASYDVTQDKVNDCDSLCDRIIELNGLANKGIGYSVSIIAREGIGLCVPDCVFKLQSMRARLQNFGLSGNQNTSPAVTVESGTVEIVDSTLSATTQDPTVLVVTGTGKVIIRRSTINEATGFTDAAIKVVGTGTADLGVSGPGAAGEIDGPGSNVINIVGTGQLIQLDTTDPALNDVWALGNSWQQDGAAIADNFTIEDNIFHQMDNGGVGRVIWVENNHYVTISNLGIQHAIDNLAVASDIIHVNTGTYEEDLQIVSVAGDLDNVELRGVGAATTKIKGFSGGNTGITPNIDIVANGVKLNGFTIETEAVAAPTITTSIEVEGTNVEISDNVFSNKQTGGTSTDGTASSVAIQTVDGNPDDVSGLHIHDNTFNGLPNNGYKGVIISPQDDDAVTSAVIIEDNTFTGNIWQAITTKRDSTTIQNNTITTDQANTFGDNLAAGGRVGIGAFFPVDMGTLSNVAITGNAIASTGNDAAKGFAAAIRLGDSTNAGTFSSLSLSDNTITGGHLTFIDIVTGAAGVNLNQGAGADADDGDADTIDVTFDGTNVIISVNGNTVFSTPKANGDTITVNGSNDDDTVTVDINAIPAGGVVVNGSGEGTGGDSLIITDDDTIGAATVTHTFDDANSGNVDVDGMTITYTGLEPITDHTNPTARVFTYNFGAETIVLDDDATANNDYSLIDSTAGESVTFNHDAATTMTINAGTGDDVVRIEGQDLMFAADLNINGQDDNDTLRITGFRAGYAGTVTVNGDDGDDTFISSASAAATASLDFAGGDGTTDTSANDSLNFDPQGDGGFADNGTMLSGAFTTVDYEEFENFNFLNAPNVDAIDDVTVAEDHGAFTVSFTSVNDGDDGSGTLTVAATSSDTSIVPNPGVFFIHPIVETDNTAAQTIIDGSGTLTVIPEPDATGTVTITLTIADSDGTETILFFDVTITAVNDAPVIASPSSGSVNEEAELVFNNISVADVDAGGDDIEVSLVVDNGTLELTAGSGVTVTNESTGSHGITFRGTVTEINTALTGLKYTGDKDFVGVDTLVITANDLGGNGSGGAQSATQAVAIHVANVNDAPVGGTDTFTTDEDSSLTITFAQLLANDTDVDTGDTAGLTVISSDIQAMADVDGDMTVDNTGVITFDATAMTITYDPRSVATVQQLAIIDGVPESFVDVFEYVIQDTTGATASGTVNVTVTAVNDTPTAETDSLGNLNAATFLFSIDAVDQADLDALDALTIPATVDAAFEANVVNAGEVDGMGLTTAPLPTVVAATAGSVWRINDLIGLFVLRKVNNDIYVYQAFNSTIDASQNTGPGFAVLDNDLEPDLGDNLSIDIDNTDTTSEHGATVVVNTDGLFRYDTSASTVLTALDTGENLLLGTIAAPNQASIMDVLDTEVVPGDVATLFTTNSETLSGGEVVATITAGSEWRITDGTRVFTAIYDADDDELRVYRGADDDAFDSFTYTIDDGNGGVDTGQVFITVVGVNDPPVANDDSLGVDQETVTAGAQLDLTAAITANDTDPEDDALTVTAVTDISTFGGTVTDGGGGAFTYHADGVTVPVNGSVTEIYSYTISDGEFTSTGTITIVITAEPNEAPVSVADGGFEVVNNTTLNISDGALLGNDSDPDNSDGDATNDDALRVFGFDTSGTSGVVLVSGTVDFPLGITTDQETTAPVLGGATPETTVNTATYDSTTFDGTANFGTITLDIDVTMALSSNASAAHIHGPADVGTDAAILQALTLSATNTTPNVSGTYVIPTADLLDDFLNGLFYVNIHTDDNAGGELRGQMQLAPAQVHEIGFPLGINSDQEVTALTTATTATAAVVTATYDSSTFLGDAGAGDSADNFGTITLNINVTGLTTNATAAHIHGPAEEGDDAAALQALTLSAMDQNPNVSGTYVIPTADLLADFLDGLFYFNIHTTDNPAGELRGQMALTEDINNGITYDPNGQFNHLGFQETETDTFTYTITDNKEQSNSSTVTVTVFGIGNPPTLDAITNVTIDEDAALPTRKTLTGISNGDLVDSFLRVRAVSSNKSLIPDPAVIFDSPISTGNTPILTATARVVMFPTPNASGTTTITVTVTDVEDANQTVVKTFDVTINPVNDRPTVTAPATVAATEDTTTAAITTISVADIDSTTVTVTVTAGNGTLTVGAAGAATITNNGTSSVMISGTLADVNTGLATLTYLGVSNFNGGDVLTVAVDDGALLATAVTAVTVAAAGDDPVAADDTFTVSELVTENLDVLANDADGDGDALTIMSVTAPDAGGTATINTELNRIIYTPDAVFLGDETFMYTITDGTMTSTATVTVTVLDVEHPPVAIDDSYDVEELSVANELNVFDNDFDPEDGSPAAGIVAVGAPANGTIVGFTVGDTVLFYTPNAAFHGTDTFTYTVEDSAGLQGSATVTINVGELGTTDNQAPTFNILGDITIKEDEDITLPAILGFAFDLSAGSDAEDTVQNVGFGEPGVGPGTPLAVTDNTLFDVTGLPAIGNSESTLVTGPGTWDLAFTPAADANGTAIVTVALFDDGGTAGNGIDESTSRTFTITIEPVNDPPSFDKAPDDNDSAPDNILLSGDVLTVGPSTAVSYQLLANVSPGGGSGAFEETTDILTFSVVPEDTSLFSVQPTINSTGVISFTTASGTVGQNTRLDITLSDDGGLSSETAKCFVEIDSINEPPVISFSGANPQTATTSTELTINGVSATFPDADPGSTVSATLTVGGTGTVDLVDSTGLTTPGGGGAADTSTWTVEGTPAAIANALASGILYFTAADGFTDTLTITVSDEGNTGNLGGVGTDTLMISIDVGAVVPPNNAPVITVPGAQTVQATSNLTFTGANAIAIADADAGDTLTVTLAAANQAGTNVTLTVVNTGNITVTGGTNPGATVTFTVSPANVNGALDGLILSSTTSGTADLDITVSDGTDTDMETVGITVTAAPVGGGGSCTDPDLLAQWAFDEALYNGTTDEVLDCSVNANHGTASGTVGAVAGQFAGAGDFDGTDKINVSSRVVTNTNGNLTIAAWINPDTFTTDAYRYIVGKSNFLATGAFGLMVFNKDPIFYVEGIRKIARKNSGLTKPVGQWYHLAGVYDRTAGQLRLYIDGTLAKTTTNIPTTLKLNVDDTAKFTIGGDGGKGLTKSFDGKIDNVQVFSTALTATEIGDIIADAGTTTVAPDATVAATGNILDMDAGTLTINLDVTNPLTGLSDATLSKSAITIQNLAASPTSSYTLTGGMLTSGANTEPLVIQLSATDLDAIKLKTGLGTSAGNSFLTTTDTLVPRDPGDNHIIIASASGRVMTHTPDTTAPTLVSSDLNLAAGVQTLTLVFNEPMNAASLDLSTSITIQNTGAAQSRALTAGLSTTSSANGRTIVINIHNNDIAAIEAFAMAGDIFVNFSNGPLDDMAGNPVANATIAVTTFTDELTPPLLDLNGDTAGGEMVGPWELDIEAGTITLHFNEIVDFASVTNDAAKKLTIQNATNSQLYTLTGRAGVAQGFNGFSVVITLLTADVDALKANTNLATGVADSYLRFTAGLITDDSGNSIAAVTAANAVQVTNYTADSTAPTLDSWDLVLEPLPGGTGTLTLNFSETVLVSSLDTTAITIQDAANSANEAMLGTDMDDLSTTSSSNGTQIVISLSDTDRAAIDLVVNGRATAYLWNTAALITDTANVPVTARVDDVDALQASSFTDDVTPPEVASWSIEFGSGNDPKIIRLNFSEGVKVDTAPFLDATDITIQNAANSVSATATHTLTTSIVDPAAIDGDMTVDIHLSIDDRAVLLNNPLLATALTNSYLSVTGGLVEDTESTEPGGLANPNVAIPDTAALQAASVTLDGTAIVYESATIDFRSGSMAQPTPVVTLTFDEIVDAQAAKVDLSKIWINNIAAQNLVPLSGATVLESTDTVWFQIVLTESQRRAVIPFAQSYGDATAVVVKLGAGAVKDLSGNGVATSWETATEIADDVSPEIANVTIDHPGGSVGPGDTVDFLVTFYESVTVTGTPTLTLNNPNSLGAFTQLAEYVVGAARQDEDPTIVRFRYGVEIDVDVAALVATDLNAAGVIEDLAGNDVGNIVIGAGFAQDATTVEVEETSLLVVANDEDVRENHLVNATIVAQTPALQTLIAAIVFDTGDLEFISADLSSNSADRISLATDSAQIDTLLDTSGTTAILWITIDTGGFGDAAIAANPLDLSVNGAGSIVDLQFRVRIGAGADEVDDGGNMVFGTLLGTDGAESIVINTAGDDIEAVGGNRIIGVDTQYSPLDVDENGEVGYATDGMYIYRAALYGGFNGLVPIVPAVHRTFNTAIISDDAVLANVLAGGATLVFDVLADAAFEAGTDAVYIFRRLRQWEMFLASGIIDDNDTVPAGHTAVAAAPINTVVDGLRPEAADTLAPRVDRVTVDDDFAGLKATIIRANESLRDAGMNGTLVANNAVINGGSLTVGTTDNIPDAFIMGIDDSRIVVDADAREFVILWTGSRGTITLDLSKVWDVAGLAGTQMLSIDANGVITVLP